MTYIAVASLLGFFGVVLLSLGCQRLMAARSLAASGNILAGFMLLAGAGLLYVLVLNLQTYTSFESDRAIGELAINKAGQQGYRATLMRLPNGELQVFTLSGDEWQLDARVLEWHGWTNALGLNRQFRLERISGHSRNPEHPNTIYTLSNNPGFDLWRWILGRPKKISFVDAASIRSASLAMTDGARYRLIVSPAGLLAQPLPDLRSSSAASR